ncbi:hypothetical protein ACP70R_019473 [Stipagrostis hirtigluma subsp. patula]
MARRRMPMTLIGNARARARTFAQRKEGLKKKAHELATLCGVDVAVVCAGPGCGGGGAPEVWASREGVIERYRALPAEERVRHTHLGYAEGELGKERAKLARVRQAGPDALPPWDAALDGMSLEEVRAVLASVDAAIRATAERRNALGFLPGGAGAGADDGQLQHVVPLGDEFEDMESWVQELMGVDGTSLNAHMVAQPARAAQHINRDVDMDGDQWQLQMPGNGDGDQCGDGSYVDMDCYQMPVPGNTSAHDGWLNLAMWGADESSPDAVVPVGYPSLDIAANPLCTPAKHLDMGIGGNFTGAPAMGMGGCFMDANGYEYGTPCLAGDFQCPDLDASQRFGLEQLHYLSDVVDGTLFSC